jgi:hypothetical protein
MVVCSPGEVVFAIGTKPSYKSWKVVFPVRGLVVHSSMKFRAFESSAQQALIESLRAVERVSRHL